MTHYDEDNLDQAPLLTTLNDSDLSKIQKKENWQLNYEFLDGVRGIGAACVMLYHFSNNTGTNPYKDLIAAVPPLIIINDG